MANLSPIKLIKLLSDFNSDIKEKEGASICLNMPQYVLICPNVAEYC